MKPGSVTGATGQGYTTHDALLMQHPQTCMCTAAVACCCCRATATVQGSRCGNECRHACSPPTGGTRYTQECMCPAGTHSSVGSTLHKRSAKRACIRPFLAAATTKTGQCARLVLAMQAGMPHSTHTKQGRHAVARVCGCRTACRTTCMHDSSMHRGTADYALLKSRNSAGNHWPVLAVGLLHAVLGWMAIRGADATTTTYGCLHCRSPAGQHVELVTPTASKPSCTTRSKNRDAKLCHATTHSQDTRSTRPTQL
jgi:hypothetical protein